jgi:hypothetical protein
VYTLENLKLIPNENIQPQFSNIKNDIVCWGKDSSGLPIRFRLGIDKTPEFVTTTFKNCLFKQDAFGITRLVKASNDNEGEEKSFAEPSW